MHTDERLVIAYPFDPAPTLDLEPEYGPILLGDSLVRIAMPVGGQAWLATAHAHVKQVLSDPRFSRAAATTPETPRLSPEMIPASSIMAQDPPEHTRLRRVIAGAFTSRRIELLRSRVRDIVDDLLDGMEQAGGPADLNTHLSVPLPLIVICELLGVPDQDRERFTALAEKLTSRELSGDEIARARTDMEERLRLLIADRTLARGEDLLSDMLDAQQEADRLSEAELVNLVVALLVGGRGSPSVFLSSSVFTLLQNPDQWQLLCEDPTLVPSAVEELLRYVPIGVAGGFVRVALEDVSVGDTLVRAGEAVVPAMIAANRDGRVFEEPDRLDITRERCPHLGFGHGAHHCVGGPLARLQAQIALDALVRRYPRLSLAAGERDTDWETGRVVRGLASLRVVW